ncbi:MAG: LysR family transcriptional regulator [Lachnospiraceae bacterium]|nr:LysR family transcriptional regulator [Lachnospiraceae bacterium]
MEMNIQKYRAFLKTVECGSFTKAAEALCYSQSGVSRMIHDLEKEWNLPLLERGRGGVRLTSDGIELLPFVRSVCEEYRKLQIQIEELNGLESGLIRIGTFSSVATHWLPNMIKEFLRDYPNIDYELLLGDYTEIEEWILEGRVDCGFLPLPAHAELEVLFSKQDELLVVLPQNHHLADCERFPIAALCEDPFLLLEKGGRGEITKIFETYHLSPKLQFTTWDDYAIMSMVESGLGISILPQLILKRIPYQIKVKRLENPVYREIGLVLREKKTASLAVRKFLEYLESWREREF